jgi:serine/threonine protein kinase/DNA-binding SARP family transcriptional activator/WD40 repeat protein
MPNPDGAGGAPDQARPLRLIRTHAEKTLPADGDRGVLLEGVDYRVLGPLKVSVEGRRLSLGGPRQQMVLAILLSRGGTVSQDALIDAVWSGTPPNTARSTLQSYIYSLRRELGSDAIVREGKGYLVDLDGHSLDARTFEALVEEGGHRLTDRPGEAGELLAEALSLWYGSPFGDLGTHPALMAEVTRLTELRLSAVEKRVEAALMVGESAGMLDQLGALVREHPLRERFWAQFMLALYRSGRQAEALRAFQRARRHLGEELGIEPSFELQTLEQEILDQNPALLPSRHPRLSGFTPTPGGDGTRTVRGYELRQLVGEGDLGRVYRAFQPTVAREVAVKEIRPEHANRADFVHDFEQRSQLISLVEHPHVVDLFDFWRDPTGAYLVMPYMRGDSLAAALRRGGWNLAPALQLLDQIGGALSSAHRHGVIHGNLKPSNILFDEEGNAYLSDFAIAARPTDEAGHPVTGSLAFVPPEELRGVPLTSRSDLYCLGTVAYQMLAGVPPPANLPLPSITEARPGLPADLDPVLRRATAIDPDERFERVEDFLRAIRQAVGADVVAVAGPLATQVPAKPTRNPYKGLRAFQETDSVDFFGRDDLIDSLCHSLADHNVVVAVGPSGSGKSSVVRAGVVSALRGGRLPGSRRWLITDMYPGSYPFEELEAALLRVAVDHPADLIDELQEPHGLLRVTKQVLSNDDATLLLIVDQFEELFSTVPSEETRRLFLDNLVAVAADQRSRLKVILTMRADFYDRPLQYAEFAQAVAASTVSVSPPTREGLAQAIAAPARAVGVEMEPGLVGRVIAEVEGQPGGLPLLQYTLTEMFGRRDGQILTVEGYEATGGVLGALGGRSEELYGELSPAGQRAAREVFLRLVTVDEVGTTTRRRARQSELKSLPVDQDELDRVLARFGAFRLLSFDRDPVSRTPTVEVAHEALLEEWGRLKGWIDDRRQDLMLSRRIGLAAQEWDDAGRDPSFLLRGARLEQADEWRQATDLSLSGLEVDFLDAAREFHTVEVAKARRLRRRIMSGLSAAVVVLTVLALFAFAQRTQARSEARSAEARRLAGAAVAAIDEDPERGVLLALEAVAIMNRRGETPLPEAIGALQEAVQATRLVARFDGYGTESLAMNGDGTWVVMDRGFDLPHARIVDLVDGTQRMLAGRPEGVSSVDVSPDDRLVAVGYDMTRPGVDGFREPREAVVLYDSDSGAEFGRLEGPAGWYRAVEFSPDGTTLAAAVSQGDDSPGTVIVWDIATGDDILALEEVHGVVWAGYSPDGNTIQVAARGRLADEEREALPTRIESFSTAGEPLDTVELPAVSGPIRLDPQGSRVALGSATARRVVVFDLEAEEVVMERDITESQELTWSKDGRVLAVSGNQGAITLIDADSGNEIMRLAGSTSSVFLMAFTPDGERLVSTYVGGETLIWDVSRTGPPDLDAIALRAGPHFGFFLAPDGDLVAAFTTRGPETGDSGGFEVHDLATGEMTMRLTGERVSIPFERRPSPDFSLVGSLPVGGDAAIRRIPTAEDVVELDACSNAVAFSPDNSLAVINRSLCDGTDRRSRVVRIDNREPFLHLPVQWVYSAAFNPEGAAEAGRYLVLTNQEIVQIWDMQKQALVEQLTLKDIGASTAFLHVAFDPRGQYLAMGTMDGLVWVADMEAFVSGSSMKDSVIFNQVAHTGPSPLPSITSEGILATVGFDGLVRLWDVHSGELLVQFRNGTGQGPISAFAPDGSYLLYSTEGGTVLRRFYLDPQRLIDLAFQRLTRELTVDECRQFLGTSTCPET